MYFPFLIIQKMFQYYIFFFVIKMGESFKYISILNVFMNNLRSGITFRTWNLKFCTNLKIKWEILQSWLITLKQICSEISLSQSLLVYINTLCNLINLYLSTECFTHVTSLGKAKLAFQCIIPVSQKRLLNKVYEKNF